MNVLTVILASPGVADGVRDVLRDLSAADLVAPFLWVDDAQIPLDGTRIPTVETVRGTDRAATLQDVLASRRVDLVRLCVLVPTAAGSVPVRAKSERMFAELLSSNAGGARLIRIRLLLQRPGDERSGTAVPALAGWHNLLIAPEDSRGPGMGHESLVLTTDAIDVGRHAAPVVAGVAGLWTDVDHAPFDDEPVLPGNSLRVVRSFYRRLDTSHAEHQLHAELLDFGGQLPLPRDAGTPVVYVDDVPAASSEMARALWTKHRHLLQSGRVPTPTARPARVITFGDALRMFGRFLLAVLMNAPSRLITRVSSTVASATQAALYGAAPGAYRVVVGGVDSDGRKVAWADYASASRQIGAALDSATGAVHRAAPDLSALWRDYARAALTLADARERSAGLPPVQVGAHRAVLRSASDIVPGPADDFDDIPGVVSATLHAHTVEAPDILGLDEFREQLRGLEQDPVIGLDARRTSSAVKAWMQRGRRSFAVGFGTILTNRLAADVTEAQAILKRLENAEELRDPAEESAEHQRTMFWRVRITTIVLVLLAVLSGVLAWRQVISWWYGGPLIALCVLVWAGVVAWICQRAQQKLEDLLARREAVTAAVEADRVNLRAALREIDDLTGAYRQYLSWSRALGAFLAQPLGVAEHTLTVHRRIEWGLPWHSAIGSGTPETEQVARVADELRQDLFTVGWLTDPWDTVVSGAGAALGGAAQDIDRDPSLLAVKAGAGSGSPLDEWSQRFHRGQVRSTGAAMLWERALGELTGPRSELSRELVAVVEHRVDGTVRRTGVDEFLAGVGRPTSDSFFDRSAFSDTATMKGLTAVVGEVPTTVRVGCGLVAVTTQYSEGISAEDLAARADTNAARGDIAHVPDIELHPAQPADARSDRTSPGSFVAPVVDGINF
ncbi:magnesium transporter [Rhodococcus sp. (in: high G+C Gram-positive bacteria)]|uniref:magnesium transporter n=1 Tax=Rhodococcus sp. TaxID=1831 RepID=UPI00388D59DA